MKLPNEESNGHLTLAVVLRVLAGFGVASDKVHDMCMLSRREVVVVIAFRDPVARVQIEWLARKFEIDIDEFDHRCSTKHLPC